MKNTNKKGSIKKNVKDIINNNDSVHFTFAEKRKPQKRKGKTRHEQEDEDTNSDI